jgi:hypothetical protein
MRESIMGAIKYVRSKGSITEAVRKLRNKEVFKEDAGAQQSQTQVWWVPNQDTANRAILYLRNSLGVEASVVQVQNGYQVHVTGSYSDQDVANAIGSLKGMRLDQPAGSIK